MIDNKLLQSVFGQLSLTIQLLRKQNHELEEQNKTLKKQNELLSQLVREIQNSDPELAPNEPPVSTAG